MLNRTMKRISFKDMKIKHKLMATMSLVILFFCIIVMISMQYVFNAYDKMIYSKSAQSINSSIGDIENELRNIEKLSMTIATDTRVQDQLRKVIGMTNEYERTKVLTDFKNKIFVYMLTEKYLSSIRFVNDDGYELMVSQNAKIPENSQKNEAVAAAKEAKGASIWVEPDDSHPYLLSAREIRSTGSSFMTSLGILMFQVNLEALLRDYKNSTKQGEILSIWKGDQPIYAPDQLFKPRASMMASTHGYEIQNIGESSFFIAYTTSAKTGWTYYSAVPFNDIFKTKNDLRKALVMVLITLVITVIAISYRLAKEITKPIERLTIQMKRAEKGDFESIILDSLDNNRLDEVGYMQRRFFIMIQRIDQLIEENYSRQLMLKDTEYRVLQAQINPHFLYNTLTSINWMARTSGQASISNMVESLSRLLRSAISDKNEIITIREELELLQDYMYIQKVRYEDDLQFELDIEERFREYNIPKMSLQPIVENAIKHGLENMLGACKITLTAIATEDRIEISITDNGPGMDEITLERVSVFDIQSKGTGIGLKNIHERLQFMFGETAGLCFDRAENQGTRVTIMLPKG